MASTPPARPLRLDALAYGGDYNPDQWSEEVWHDDIALMRKAGVNLVTLPVFSWPQLEPAPGEFDWGWLDRIVDLLWDAGIHIDLATATATPPSWLIRRHPEMLPWDADGTRLDFGSRQAYCPSSPIWRAEVARMCRAMAERYGSHPAVVLWHVSNEFGDHVSRCWCPESARHFRRWLHDRYGSLEALNHAWGATVWGQRYSAWEHIEPPRAATGPVNPTQLLDFERFSSDALLELFQLEVDILHELTPELPVTTNFMSLLRDLNYWNFAAVEDLVTDDAYPDPADPLAHVPAALNYGLMRSLKGGQPWLLLEQASSAVSWREVNVPKSPGRMRIDSLQAIAHGSDGAMFFQWRQARYGQEKFHSAMLGHRGEQSRLYREVRAFGAELARLSAVRGTRVRSRIALVVDWDSWWGASAIESLPSQGLRWITQARAWHAALWALGHPVDVVRATGPFDDYDVVVIPNLYIATTEQAAEISAYVQQGGHVVVGPFSGVVDVNEHVHPGGAPGPLRALVGVEVDEQWPYAEGRDEAIAVGEASFANPAWGEWIETDADVEAFARYTSGDLADRPAVTRKSSGAGTAWYVSCALGPDGAIAVLRSVLDRAGLPTREHTDPHFEAVTRADDTTDYTFLLNHGERELAVDVPDGSVDLLTGARVSSRLTLSRFGAAVLAAPRSSEPPFFSLSLDHN